MFLATKKKTRLNQSVINLPSHPESLLQDLYPIMHYLRICEKHQAKNSQSKKRQ